MATLTAESMYPSAAAWTVPSGFPGLPDLPGIFSGRSGASGLLGYRYGIPGSTGVCRAICSVTEREIPGTGYYA